VAEFQYPRQIIETAREQFLVFGFSKVTTDEIAAGLGISKKTLYKHFSSKVQLLESVMQLTMDEIKIGATEILEDQTLEFVPKLEKLLFFLGTRIRKLIRQPLLEDLRKKAPQVWQQVEDFREQMIKSKFTSLVEEGMKNGAFRRDLKKDVFILIYLNAIQQIINPESLSELPYTPNDIFQEIVKTLFTGILNESAKKQFMEIS